MHHSVTFDAFEPIILFSFYFCLYFRFTCLFFRHFMHHFVFFDTFEPIILFSFFSLLHLRCKFNFDILCIILSFLIHFDRSSFLAFIPAYVLDAHAFSFDILLIISSFLIHLNRSSFLAFIFAYILEFTCLFFRHFMHHFVFFDTFEPIILFSFYSCFLAFLHFDR